MDLAKVLAQLHAELDNLNSAIASLERLQVEAKAGPGRPRKSVTAETPDTEANAARKG
jgi:hypothetical protein